MPAPGRWIGPSIALGAALLALLAASGARTVGEAPAPLPIAPPAGSVSAAIEAAPLTFTPAPRSSSGAAAYVARGPGYSIAFEPGRALVSIEGGGPTAARPDAAPTRLTVGIEFLGADTGARIAGREPTDARVSYLTGDPSSWEAALPAFGRVAYEEIWPATDVVFHGTGEKLEYDFVVRPGGDPGRIQFAYQGVRDVSLAANGDLVLETELGRLTDTRPVTYQTIDGRRHPVESRFVLDRAGAGTRVGIAVGPYDASLPLVVDPALVYSHAIGPVTVQDGHAIALGSDGSVYVAGSTWTADFPTTPGAFQPRKRDRDDAFVAKLDPTGSRLVYSTFLGGDRDEFANDLALAPDGSVYVAGGTESRDFPTTPGAYDRKPGIVKPFYYRDAFVARLSADGSKLLASTFLGGTLPESIHAIAFDRGGVAVAGTTDSSDFPTTPGAFQTGLSESLDSGDAFVARLGSGLRSLSYATYLGGRGDEFLRDIAVDAAGNVTAVGRTTSSNFPTTPGAYDTDPNVPPGLPPTVWISEAYVTKLNPTGSALVYSTFLGGPVRTDDESAISVALGPDGSAYVAGNTDAPDFPTTPGAYRTTYVGNGEDADRFVSRLDPTGSTLLLSSFTSGSHVALDGEGSIYLADGIGKLEKLDPTGTTLEYTTRLGLFVLDLAVDEAGVVYVTGWALGGGSAAAPREAFTTSLAGAAASKSVVRGLYTTCTIEGTAAGERLVGTAKRDVICGAGGRDVIRGGGGSDIIVDGSGASVVDGGAGADTILGQGGNDVLIGGPGGDRLSGGAGRDRLRGGTGNDFLVGGPGGDVLTGAAGRDRLFGGAGADVLNGGTAADRLFGNAGRDRLIGGAGADRLDGGAAADRCIGGLGLDVLRRCEL